MQRIGSGRTRFATVTLGLIVPPRLIVDVIYSAVNIWEDFETCLSRLTNCFQKRRKFLKGKLSYLVFAIVAIRHGIQFLRGNNAGNLFARRLGATRTSATLSLKR